MRRVFNKEADGLKPERMVKGRLWTDHNWSALSHLLEKDGCLLSFLLLFSFFHGLDSVFLCNPRGLIFQVIFLPQPAKYWAISMSPHAQQNMLSSLKEKLDPPFSGCKCIEIASLLQDNR